MIGGLVAQIAPSQPVALPPPPPPPPEVSAWETTALMLAPIIGYALLAPILWVFFRRTWRDLDLDAHEHQRELLASGRQDFRPAALFVIVATSLMLQEYFGDRDFYGRVIHPFLRDVMRGEASLPFGLSDSVDLAKYGELYSFGWWAFTRFVGYTVFPLAMWKILFRNESILDLGLRMRGFREHAWIYLLCLSVVVPAVFIVANQPDFGTYYPFYSLAGRSWFDFIAWEVMYIAQFLGLEIFFRGFMLSGLRKSLGSGAIFAMVVPYCMIHFGKPYLETAGAVVAGIALGSLAMRTRSIYAGFLVHVTIALLMDTVALHNRGALPVDFWPPEIWPPPPPASAPLF